MQSQISHEPSMAGQADDLLRLATPDDRMTIQMLERVQEVLPGNSDLDSAVEALRRREVAREQLACLPGSVLQRELATRQRLLGGAE